MATPINRAHARRLFDLLEVEIDNVNLYPREYRGGIRLCGFADFLISVRQQDLGSIPLLQMNGNAIKLVGKDIRFDPKSEPGKKVDPVTHRTPYFPHWFPRTVEVRAVLDIKISRHPKIQGLVAEAIEALSRPPTHVRATSSDNPF